MHAFLKVDVLMLKPRNLNRKDAKYAKQSNAKFTILGGIKRSAFSLRDEKKAGI